MAENIQDNVIAWLKKQKGWQTELAYRILDHNIDDSDIDTIVEMVKAQSEFVDKQFPIVMAGLGGTHNSLRLCEIGNIKNIEGLAPRKPLGFENGTNLFVVYGANGSGKSSYTKIIKRLCGAPHAAELKSNVFNSDSSPGECTVSFISNGEAKMIQWKSSDVAIPQLSSIDVFDSDIARIYLQDANTSTYTPMIITLFDELARCYGLVSQRLQDERNALASKLPIIPSEYAATAVAKTYKSLSKDCVEESLSAILVFSKDDSEQLDLLKTRLSETNPARKAAEIRTHKKSVLKIADDLEKAFEKVNEASQKQFYCLQSIASAKRAVATEAAAVLERQSVLPSIGSPVWKKLWEAAKKYSEEEAYKTHSFPYLGDEARCVLCHQKLDEPAKDRFKSFLNYIGGAIEQEATQAENSVKVIFDNLPIIPLKEEIEISVSAADLPSEWIPKLEGSWAIIDSLKQHFLNHDSAGFSQDCANEGQQDMNGNIQTIITQLKEIANTYEQQAVIYDADAKSFDWQQAQSKAHELSAKKWCSEQKAAILEEITRLQKIATYDTWISQCRTNAVTSKAGEVANAVITESYLRRFNSELKKLHAGKLKVSIASYNTKGVVKHSLTLKGITSSITPYSILSEGEGRIVSLAAFLADVTANDNASPFIFDDPISSLDQEFEESVVERLVELSQTRQVIVFTHRLSVLGMLNEKSDKTEIITIRTEPWGPGEIGNTPLFAKKTAGALRALKSEYLARAKKAYQDGYDAYYPLGKQLCSDLRILVERSVEMDLLSDVVQRYRRAVNTLGKIQNLTRIQKADCDLIDDFMTRYSCFEHSQSTETPLEIPPPDEIEKDIDKLLAWQQEFSKRQPKD